MTDDQHMPLVEEALHWLAVLQDRDASAADRSAFQAWLAASPAHAAAWQRAQYVWQRLDALAPAIHRDPVLRRDVIPLHAIRPAPTRRRWMQLAAAASMAAAAGGYVLAPPGLLADYRTTVAERRQLRLADGSQVELGSDSALSVDFGSGTRLVTLYRGEAYFSVAADAARPFIVRAAGGRTRALGTAFNVKSIGGLVTVTVTEHAVEVAAPRSGQIGGGLARVAEGQQVRYGTDGLSAVAAADLAGALGWRQNRLIFQDLPLGAVVADLARYSRSRFVITDGALESLPVTGVFDTDAADAAIDTIARTLPIRLHRLGRLLTVISPAG